MHHRPTIALGLLTAVALCTGVAATEPDPAQAPAFRLEVGRLIDPDLPPIPDERLARIFDSATRTFEQKFGYGGLEFVDRGTLTLREFLDRNPADSCAMMEQRYPLDGSRVPPMVLAAGRVFLQRWKLDELKAFFPEAERATLPDLGSVRRRLMKEFGRKIELIRGIQLKGRSLIDPAVYEHRSYTHFICSVRQQRQFDLLLTNGFFLYDYAAEPYPHAVFGKLKAGGSAMPSKHREALRGRALMTSTFGIDTNLPFFQDPELAALSLPERDELLGSYILAHELAHAIFKIPDTYDHPAGCLMTTKMHEGYLSGYREQQAHPEPCPKCRPYVEARLAYFRGEALYRAGEYEQALAAFAQVVRKTPRHVEGSFRKYMSEVSIWAARCYERLARPAKALRMVTRALKLDPENAEARSMRDRYRRHGPMPASKPTPTKSLKKSN